jgi:hypothetical protein
MRWYLHAYPQLDFGKMPSSLFCVACSEGKSHRASMRAARAGLDPLEASVGDGFSVDIKTSTTPGCDDLAYTAIVVSRRTKYAWALHAATKDLLRAKLRVWYLAYTLRYSAVNGPLLMFRADNDTALVPPADTAFWDSYGVVLSFSAESLRAVVFRLRVEFFVLSRLGLFGSFRAGCRPTSEHTLFSCFQFPDRPSLRKNTGQYFHDEGSGLGFFFKPVRPINLARGKTTSFADLYRKIKNSLSPVSFFLIIADPFFQAPTGQHNVENASCAGPPAGAKLNWL